MLFADQDKSLLDSRRAAGSTTPLLAALACLLLAPLALTIDLPVSRYCLSHGVPGDLRRVLDWSEIVAHGMGVMIIAAIIYALDQPHRRWIPRLLITTFLAGAMADTVKLFVARVRPHNFDGVGGVTETFLGWVPLLHTAVGDSLFAPDTRFRSFPSAHTAVAVAMAFGLTRIYPQGRLLFGFLAFLAAAQRINAGAHYVSDTLVGAAVGALVFAACEHWQGLGKLLARIELPRR